MNPGDKLLVIHIDDSDGRDAAASELNGVEARIKSIDDDGRIYLEGYSEGIYFLRLVTDEGVITKKLVVQ